VHYANIKFLDSSGEKVEDRLEVGQLAIFQPFSWSLLYWKKLMYSLYIDIDSGLKAQPISDAIFFPYVIFWWADRSNVTGTTTTKIFLEVFRTSIALSFYCILSLFIFKPVITRVHFGHMSLVLINSVSWVSSINEMFTFELIKTLF